MSPRAAEAEEPRIGVAQIAAAIRRRRERRAEIAAELIGALAALARAVEQHAASVADLRGAVEARGAGAPPSYDALLARFKSELRAAERSLAELRRVAGQGEAEPL